MKELSSAADLVVGSPLQHDRYRSFLVGRVSPQQKLEPMPAPKEQLWRVDFPIFR